MAFLANESRVRIQTISTKDIPFLITLIKDEGWNQTELDWHILRNHPLNFNLIAFYNEDPAGTASAMVYGEKLAWICMVLVKKEYRGKGISKILLDRILSGLKEIPLIGLDATPLGLPVYEKLGFKSDFTIDRLTIQEPAPFRVSSFSDVAAVTERDLCPVIQFDELVTGANRDYMVRALIRNFPRASWLKRETGSLSGFALGRKGSRFHQVGPVMAQSEETAMELLNKAFLHPCNLPVVIDIPSARHSLLSWLTGQGFVFQRSFTRMFLPGKSLSARREFLYAIAGPEFG